MGRTLKREMHNSEELNKRNSMWLADICHALGTFADHHRYAVKELLSWLWKVYSEKSAVTDTQSSERRDLYERVGLKYLLGAIHAFRRGHDEWECMAEHDKVWMTFSRDKNGTNYLTLNLHRT